MDGMDRLIAALALAGLGGFLAIIVWFVQEPDLTIVMLSALLLAAYDFWFHDPGRARRTRSGDHSRP